MNTLMPTNTLTPISLLVPGQRLAKSEFGPPHSAPIKNVECISSRLWVIDFTDGKSTAPLPYGEVWVCPPMSHVHVDVTEGDEYAKLAVEGRAAVRREYAGSRERLGLPDTEQYRSDCTGSAQR